MCFSRLQFLKAAAVGAISGTLLTGNGCANTTTGGASTGTAGGTGASAPKAASPFARRLALNTATISGFRLPLARQIEIAAAAGYDAIEPWLGDLAAVAATGAGALRDAAKRRADAGLAVAGGIAFAPWIVGDATARAKGLDQLRRDMELIAAFGGTTIAAPPAGAYDPPALDLDRVAERYRAALELGDKTGVTPMLEFWGGAATLSRLDQCAYVAARAAHPNACVLADVFHMRRGGSAPATLRLFGASSLRCLHVNDYPAGAPATLRDADRVWPGDGIAPWREIFAALAAAGAAPWLSVEVFNERYWRGDPLATARAGREKIAALAATLS
ncbi:MAG: sugar phosphate isomerase/epimerase [Puniceicoccales bacterium]|jgi:2-keto-myo-inositol isomerase|nr:sugar phosphate isomerase/epimerase [Puniceicoccales bacterium]